jgi:hypothetical protein
MLALSPDQLTAFDLDAFIAHAWLGADHPSGDKGRGASTFRAQYQDCSTIERDALLEYVNSSIPSLKKIDTRSWR